MDLTKIAEIIENTFKNALDKPIYRYGMPTKRGVAEKSNTGSLRNSIEAIPNNYGIFVYMNDYGKWVQSGRQRGKYVPIKPIEEWIKQRGISFKDKKGKQLTTKQMAFAISTNIKNYGIPSDPSWMDVAVEDLMKNKDLDELLGEMTVGELIEKLQGI